MNAEITEMLTTNQRQKSYYEVANGAEESPANGLATNLYRGVRRRCLSVCHQGALLDELAIVHKDWVGELRGKRVLELGAGSGSNMSVWFAERADEYHAIDLSAPRLKELQAKLDAAGVADYRLHAGDFLESLGELEPFDVIYARSVLHHFRHIEAMLDILIERLVEGGVVVAFDPLQTWWPARLIRALYRPLQSDADWEFPFTARSFAAIQSRFCVDEVRGYFGKAKWAMPMAIVAPRTAALWAQSAHEHDRRGQRTLEDVRDCLQVSMLLRKPASGAIAA